MIVTRFPKGLDREGVSKFLLKQYSIYDIADTAAYYLMSAKTEKISISRQAFEEHFRIIGEKDDGTPETRGRKPLSRENENNNLFNNE